MTVDALVLTFRRERLATAVVTELVEVEGIPPNRVYLVVNGVGGLLDEELEASINVLRLPENIGPAGGFRTGLKHVLSQSDGDWIYVCEDDVSLFDLPTPRVTRVLDRFASYPGREQVGAIVAYGRDLDPKTGFAPVHSIAATGGFEPLDVAAWGASLLSRRVLEAGVLPDEDWFFGLEDFDFWLRMQAAGFDMIVDVEAAIAATNAEGHGRVAAFEDVRPTDAQEPWRSYYQARNFLEFRRRWGHSGWTRSHLIKTVRRLQLAPDWMHRRAILAGLRDGLLGRMGKNNSFERVIGEH